MKKYSLISFVAGIVLFVFGLSLLDTKGPFSFLGYNSVMKTIMEIAPWFFLILGAFGIIAAMLCFVKD